MKRFCSGVRQRPAPRGLRNRPPTRSTRVGRSLGRSLTAPPGKICPIPAVLPTPGAGFGREGGRAERPGQATDLAGRPGPPSPPSPRRRRCGKAGGPPSRTSARPPIFNLPPGLTLPQEGSRFPAPVATRVCRHRSRREPEAASASPPPAQRQRDVGRRRNAPRRSAPEPPPQRKPGTTQAHPARPWGSGRSERRSLRGMPGGSGGRQYSVTAATPTMRRGVWGASSRFPAVGLPELGHVCMAAGPASATGDWPPLLPPRSPRVPPSYVSIPCSPRPECASIRRRVVVMAALSEAFLSLDTTTPSPPRSRPSQPSGL
ncbi:proline-rich protein HaeIII subfamily 1-like [Onychomys torridus]|uniref:proline-rich protein HaeIII subfamily 1-like n=1 Tax=Onychomys torridus TaxID=38674 RepID=UPI00167F8DEC|nr:proline-rich protein HaeIII subfamily 1-like [Onychomys torridus]